MTVAGDYFIKTATQHSAGILSLPFVIGAVLYGFSAVGWFYLLLHHSLTWVAVSYSVSTLIFLALLGVVVFEETIRSRDVLAVSMALGAMLLIRQG